MLLSRHFVYGTGSREVSLSASWRMEWEKSAEAIVFAGNEPHGIDVEDSQCKEGLNH